MLSTVDSGFPLAETSKNDLPIWFYQLLKCPQCCVGGLSSGGHALICDRCAATYPVANGVPMLLRPDSMVDTAAVIGANLGGVDPESVERAFGTALRFRLHDLTLRGEFTQIVDRYERAFQDPVPAARADRPVAAACAGPSLGLLVEYFNPLFKPGEISFRSFRVKNLSGSVLATVGERPFHLSYWLEDEHGTKIEGVRSRFPIPLQPGHEMTIPLRIQSPAAHGRYRITVMLVQELVGWNYDNPVFSGEMSVSDAEPAGPAIVVVPHGGSFDFDEDLARCGTVLAQAVAMARDQAEARNIRVLEVACGSDPQALRHYQDGTDVVACDLSFPQVQLSALSFARRAWAPPQRSAFAAADVFNLPFKPDSFHIVVVCAALHHFTDVVAALRRFATMLAPGGRLVLLREPGKVVPEDATYIRELANGFNEQQFVPAEYETMFERAGLAVVHHRMDFDCSYKVILRAVEDKVLLKDEPVGPPPEDDVPRKDEPEGPKQDMDDRIDNLLRLMRIEPDEPTRAALWTGHETVLAAMVGMLDRPDVEHTYKMMRTRWRNAPPKSDNDPVYVGLPGFARKETFLETFDANFAPRLAGRRAGFRRIFEVLTDHFPSRPLIVETGCLRIPGNWELDGQSTFQFDEFARFHDGIVMSVDLTPESVDTARRACGPRTSVVLNDSVNFLHQLGQVSERRIGLLYLDSFDCEPSNWMPSAIHHMKELTAAWRLLGPGSVVCVDDYGGGQGKGTLLDDFFANLNVRVLVEGVQKAWLL